MEYWQKEALLRHRMAILDDLYVDYVLDHLLAHQVLYEEHKESIFSQSGRRNRARHLLDLLPSLGPVAYYEFVNSLKVPYNWLSQILSQESEKTVTNVASTSYHYTKSALQNEQVSRNLEEMYRLLANLSSVTTTCGRSLCAVGDALSTLGNELRGTTDTLSENSVFRQNSINMSMNEGSLSESSQDVNMDRLRGGGDADEGKLINHHIEGLRASPVTPTSTNDIFDLGRDKLPTEKHGCDSKESEEVGKTINRVSDKEQTISGVITKGIIQGEYGSAVVQNGQLDEVDSVRFHSVGADVYQNGSTDALVQGFMTSPNDELLKDSPDSGIGDMHLIKIAEGINSLKIKSQSGVNSFDGQKLIHQSMTMDQRPDNADNFGMPSSVSPVCTTEKYFNLTELTPVLDEIENLRHALKDMIGAVRSIVQLSDETLKIANNISN